MKSLRVLFAACFFLFAAAVTGIVVLAAFTSWWVLFALFAVPPLLMPICGVAMMSTGGSFAGSCAQMPCASWFGCDPGRARLAD